MTTTVWDFNSIKERLDNSDYWIARAIYRLAKNFDDNTYLVGLPEHFPAASDKIFFESLLEKYLENGFFTDRQIDLARLKIREPYIHFLVHVASFD